MTEVEDSHAIMSMLQSEAAAAKSSQGVERLVKLLNKVLARLRRGIKTGAARNAAARKVCKSQLATFAARVERARQSIRVLKIKIGIAKHTVAKSVDDAAFMAGKISRATREGGDSDARLKVLSEEKRTRVARWKAANAETQQLVKLLRAISSKLTSNGLVEVGSQLSSAAASTNDAASAIVLMSIAAKAKTGNDVSDVHDMIDLLIGTLLGDIKGNIDAESKYTRSWRNMVGAVTGNSNSIRGTAKSLIAQRDRIISTGDKARQLILALNVQLKAKRGKVRATKRLSKATKNSCRAAKKAFVSKRARNLKQIRVMTEIIKTLRNTKLTAAMVTKLASVKLNLPVWKKGAWSACSKKCGLGKQTRTVSCSGAKCRGNKPRASKACTVRACASNCIVSSWSAFSQCSTSCGGGVQTRTRKIFAYATGGGKACPSTAGLKQTKACNMRACPAKQSKSVRLQHSSKKLARQFKKNAASLRNAKRTFKRAQRKAASAVKSARQALKVAKQRLAKAKANGRAAAIIARRRAAVSKAKKVWARVRQLNKRLAPAKRVVTRAIRRLAAANRAVQVTSRRVVALRARAAANPSKQNRAAVRVAVKAQARARAVAVQARASVRRATRSFMRIVRAIVRRVFRSFGRRRG
jgi:hypothetical protein